MSPVHSGAGDFLSTNRKCWFGLGVAWGRLGVGVGVGLGTCLGCVMMPEGSAVPENYTFSRLDFTDNRLQVKFLFVPLGFRACFRYLKVQRGEPQADNTHSHIYTVLKHVRAIPR